MANYAFQLRVSNDRNDDLQHIPGQYGSVVSDTWTPAACNAGFLCTKGDHLAEGGYKMLKAATGEGGEVYACNPGDVNRVADGDNLYAVGAKTLGLGVAAGVKETFTKCIPGEVYAFGPSNFSTLVTSTNKYATIVNGLLVGDDDEPDAGTGIYFVLDAGLGIDSFVEGNYNACARYNLLCCKN